MKKKGQGGRADGRFKSSVSAKTDFSEEYSLGDVLKTMLRIEHEIPPGIKVLILFSSIMAIIYIILASMFSFTILLGVIVQGTAARLINIIIIVLISFMIFGVAKKKMWAYKMANYIFTFVIINSLISMFFIKQSVSGILTVFVTLSFFFILLMNFVTLWYVRHKKSYFIHHYHSQQTTKTDRMFIYGLTSLWIVFIFISVIIGNTYYNDTVHEIDIIMDELYSTYPYEVEDYCISESSNHDLCLMTGAIVYAQDLNSLSMCGKITSELYKYTCLKAIQGDII